LRCAMDAERYNEHLVAEWLERHQICGSQRAAVLTVDGEVLERKCGKEIAFFIPDKLHVDNLRRKRKPHSCLTSQWMRLA